MKAKTLNRNGVAKLRKWLGDDGRDFFTELKKNFGNIGTAILFEGKKVMGGIPHPVHFREGMQVRNFLRTLPECKDWDAHDLDNNWASLVEKALGLRIGSNVEDK